MPVGLQTWRADGTLSLSITTRLLKVLGRVYFPSFNLTAGGSVPSNVNGSLQDGRLANGELFYFFTPGGNSRPYYDGWAALGPAVSLSGTTLSWVWDADTVRAWKAATLSYESYAGDCYLNYGIF